MPNLSRGLSRVGVSPGRAWRTSPAGDKVFFLLRSEATCPPAPAPPTDSQRECASRCRSPRAWAPAPPRPAPKWRPGGEGEPDRVRPWPAAAGSAARSPHRGVLPARGREGGRGEEVRPPAFAWGPGSAASTSCGAGLAGRGGGVRLDPPRSRGRRGGRGRREAAGARQEVRAVRFGAAPAPHRVPGGPALPPRRPRRRGSRCLLPGVVRSPASLSVPGPRGPAAAAVKRRLRWDAHRGGRGRKARGAAGGARGGAFPADPPACSFRVAGSFPVSVPVLPHPAAQETRVLGLPQGGCGEVSTRRHGPGEPPPLHSASPAEGRGGAGSGAEDRGPQSHSGA